MDYLYSGNENVDRSLCGLSVFCTRVVDKVRGEGGRGGRRERGREGGDNDGGREGEKREKEGNLFG